jgi:hypothetical protein
LLSSTLLQSLSLFRLQSASLPPPMMPLFSSSPLPLFSHHQCQNVSAATATTVTVVCARCCLPLTPLADHAKYLFDL